LASLSLTPRGHLLFIVEDDAFSLSSALVHRLGTAFGRGSGHGLFELGAGEVATALPADLSYWRDFGARLVTAICTHPDLAANHAIIPAPALDDLDAFVAAAPPMVGAEYLTASVLEALWTEAATAFRSELVESKESVESFLHRRNAAWHLVGRVHFNLAENRRDDEAPFAFLATYTTRLSTEAKAQHLPLGRALSEYDHRGGPRSGGRRRRSAHHRDRATRLSSDR
jgi:non-specific serine/threonine protein kinase